MQQSVTGVAYETSNSLIQYVIVLGMDDPSPLVPPWMSGPIASVQTFAGASQPPDDDTATNIITALPPWNYAEATAPGPGLALIAAPPSFDPAQWFKWVVSGGRLTQKTEIHLRVSGARILADSPIATTLQVGNPSSAGSLTVSMTGGVASLPGPLPSGTPVHIIDSDPTYWSDQNFFA
ncbi:MAG TPA: hypothetical protein VKW70_07295 [Terriglobia bacterium]|nr:hypothetical protein [Terriglobia bacterium]